jgi:hypothetical protein
MDEFTSEKLIFTPEVEKIVERRIEIKGWNEKDRAVIRFWYGVFKWLFESEKYSELVEDMCAKWTKLEGWTIAFDELMSQLNGTGEIFYEITKNKDP